MKKKKIIKIEVVKGEINYTAEGFTIYEIIGILTAYKNMMEIEHLNSLKK